jgi:dTMP kinase
LVAVLRIRPFRRLWLTLGLSSFGDWLGLLATSLFAAHQVTGSFAQGAAFGGVVVMKLLPALVLLPLAGLLADKFDRRITMVVCDIARFVLFLSIPLAGLLANPVAAVTWALIATFLVEAISLIWIPAKEAAVPNLVPGRLEAANQLSLITTYGIAPVLAALVLAAIDRGMRGLVHERAASLFAQPFDVALYLNALTFLAAAVVVYFIPEISGRGVALASSKRGWIGSLIDGWQFLHHNAALRGLVLGICGAFAAGGVVVGTSTFYATSLGAGPAAFGLLFAALFIGLGLGMAVGPRLVGKLSRRRWFGMSIVFAAAMVALLGVAPHLSIALPLVLLVGFGSGMAFLSGTTLLGSETRDWVRGRVFAFVQGAVRVVLLLSIAISSVLVGLGNDYVPVVGSARILLLAAGLLGVLAGVLAFRRMDDRPGVPLLRDIVSSMRGRPLGVPDPRINTGLFVAFEGGEGAGKSTQAVKLAAWMRMAGQQCVVTREPGATPAGARMRGILLDPRGDKLSSRAEALLYAADRAEHVATVIRPALKEGAVVVTDRYVDSSLAYQGAGRELPVEEIRWLSGWATGELRPNLTVLLDIDPQAGLARARQRGATDRLEDEEISFHERVRDGFRNLAAADPERYLVIDAGLPEEEIATQVRIRIAQIMPGAPDPINALPWDADSTTNLDPDLDSMLAVTETQDLRTIGARVEDATQRLDPR